MALDKLVDSTQLDTDLTSVANAIRTKGGTSASLAFPADFVSAIAAIPSGGGGLPVSVLNHEVVTPASDITQSNKLSLDLTPTTNYLLVYFATDAIGVGTTGRGLCSALMQIGSATVARVGNFLRADGTIGTDSGALGGYNKTTGVLSFPNSSYSNLVAGKTYEFWLFDVGGVS